MGGKVESVSAFERDKVYDFYKSHYSPENLVLASTGNVKHRELVDMAQETFKDFPSRKPLDFRIG